ncbi:MAG: hypothetical protein M3P49_04010 [Actinomycetota bacterium]|nr:hypothetical protein [Actinomycetota bacterium]
MSVIGRNARVTALMESLFERASERVEVNPITEAELEELFSTSVWGFREILLVIVIARLLDSSYRASTAFYSCKPRALYEGPIRAELLKRGIPHRKSGPLNIAKATIGINDQWAAQRSPAKVAATVVRLVRKIEDMSSAQLETFAAVVHGRLLAEASRVESLKVEARPEADPGRLYGLCRALIDEEPDAGNTPQRIVGYLMQSFHEELQTGLKVEGHEDRASVTSTTSKKPGDINEEQLDGTLAHVYEVTVKPFGPDRMRESYETVRDYDRSAGTETLEVLVICRREDRHPDADEGSGAPPYLGKVEHQDLTYHFIDLYSWMMAELLTMTPAARLAFYGRLDAYISDPNTSERVKRLWRRLLEQ